MRGVSGVHARVIVYIIVIITNIIIIPLLKDNWIYYDLDI